MSDINALDKFSCPACGARAVWNPAKKMLICPYCGTESPAEIKNDGTLVEESDLVQALRSISNDQKGWDTAKKTVRCQSCNAISVFSPQVSAKRCDFCGSPSLIPEDDMSQPIRPIGLLPFTVTESKIRESIRQWYGKHWFAPNNLKSKALTDTVHGVYIPYWTFDAHVDADWKADAGEYYYTTDSNGKSEQHVRWYAVSGNIQHFFDDTLIPASKGVHPNLIHKIEPYPTTTEIKPYDPGYVSGWVVEQYQIDLLDAAKASQARMDDALKAMCISEINADTHRNLVVNSEYSDRTFKHVLLPVWLLTYNYGRKSYQVIVNGSTGKIAGEYPLSWIKVTIAVILGLILLVLILMSQE